jgi:FKBP-type peptidyl-prolyl cis-trans isomerase
MKCASNALIVGLAALGLAACGQSGGDAAVPSGPPPAKTATAPALAVGATTKTDSGIAIRVIKAGADNAAMPTTASVVRVHYEGKLDGGQVFDSSYQRGEPVRFGVTDVIPGWTEVLQRMRVGDVWEVRIPPNLAYGEAGAPPGCASGPMGAEACAIPPGAFLTFKIELLDVQG